MEVCKAKKQKTKRKSNSILNYLTTAPKRQVLENIDDLNDNYIDENRNSLDDSNGNQITVSIY